MLELFTKHGGFDLKLAADGDLDVDQHHTVEDVGIVLGQFFAKALGDRKGINRAGYFVLPMDETLAVVALDLGGRPALVYKDLVKVRLVGDLQTELVEDFFGGFVNHAGANLHAKVLYGRSNHHKIEAIFKCFARALKYACSTTRASRTSFLPPRDCYDRHLRLRRGQPAHRPEHPGRDRRRIHPGSRRRRSARRPTRSSCPGVGHFGQMMRALDDLDVREALVERIRAGVPFLGICLGLQALFESSEEAPEARGLGIFPASCAASRPMRASRTWAGTNWSCDRPRSLCDHLGPRPYVYFAHSYYVPVDPSDRRDLHLCAALYRRARITATSSACNSIPKNPAPWACRSCSNFLELTC